MNKTRKYHGADEPVFSRHVTREFKGGCEQVALAAAPARGLLQLCGGNFGRYPMQLDDFMTRGLATDQLDLVSAAVKFFGQQTDEGIVGGGIHRRGGDFDAELVAERIADLIAGGAGLQFHRKHGPFRTRPQITRDVHLMKRSLEFLPGDVLNAGYRLNKKWATA